MFVDPTTEIHPRPVVLEHPLLRLEPISPAHAPGLASIMEVELFRWFAGEIPADNTLDSAEKYVQRRLKAPAISLVMVHPQTGTIVGHSSFMTIRPKELGLEIGSTWIGRKYHGTQVNPAAKYLMLRHAFEELGCVRVELKTDERNLHSQTAIAKLGAKREGILRHYQVMADGFVRNTVMFSILREEWPDVKAGLEARLEHWKTRISE